MTVGQGPTGKSVNRASDIHYKIQKMAGSLVKRVHGDFLKKYHCHPEELPNSWLEDDVPGIGVQTGGPESEGDAGSDTAGQSGNEDGHDHPDESAAVNVGEDITLGQKLTDEDQGPSGRDGEVTSGGDEDPSLEQWQSGREQWQSGRARKALSRMDL